MNANYLYDIFAITEKNDAPDLTIGFAMLKAEQEIPAGMTDKGIRTFLGRHYAVLVKAYKLHDREIFAEAVGACESQDSANQELRVE